MKPRSRRALAALFAIATCAAVVLDQALAAAILGAVHALVLAWSYRLLRVGRVATRPAGYTAAVVLAFARSTPALLVAVSDQPAGWLDGVALRDRRTLAAAGLLHVDPGAGLTLTSAGYALASRL